METVAQAVALVGVRARRPVGRGTACARPAGGIEAGNAGRRGPHHEIVRSFTDGDTAIIEGVFTARHTGPMPTPDGQIPPTGNTVSFPFSCFFRVRDSRCVSYHIYYDNTALMATP